MRYNSKKKKISTIVEKSKETVQKTLKKEPSITTKKEPSITTKKESITTKKEPTIIKKKNDSITYVVGNPYFIKGVKYIPQEDYFYNKTGLGTFYGKELHKIKTANNDLNKVTELLPLYPATTIYIIQYI